MTGEKLTIKQLGVLAIFACIGDSIIILPSSVAGISSQDAWLSTLIGLGVGLCGCALLLRLRRNRPTADLIQLLHDGFGRWAGGAVGFCFLYFFVLNTASIVRELGDFLAVQMMAETPIRATHLLFILVLAWGMRSGMPAIARAGEVLFPWFVLFMTALIVLLIPRIEPERIRPVAAESLSEILHGSIVAGSYPFAELVVFAMLWPVVRPSRKLAKDFLLAVAIGGFVLLLVVLISIMVLGPFLTAHQIYPSYALAKKISVGHFLERVEALLAISWMLSLFFKGALYFYASLASMGRLFGLQNVKSLTLPLAAVVYGLAFEIAPNTSYFNRISMFYWPYWDYLFAYLFPLLLLAVLAIRRRRPA